MFIIGRNPVTETLKFNAQTIRKIVLLEGLSDNKIRKIISLADKNNIKIEFKNNKEFAKLFDKKDKSEGISQGIIAEADEFAYADEKTAISSLSDKANALVLILDEIQDPHNLGAIIRTAAASGMDLIVTTAKNSAKVNHTVIKASAGAAYNIDIVQSVNIYKTIEILKNTGFKIIGTSLKTDKSVYDIKYSGKIALIFGNEGEGVRKNLLKLCDDFIFIPISGKVESLNVSVAAGVILYEILRQRK